MGEKSANSAEVSNKSKQKQNIAFEVLKLSG
jgi:hypothetical protein